MLTILQRRARVNQAGRAHRPSTVVNLSVLAGLLVLPIVVGAILNRISFDVVSTAVWQFVFSGFGEEIRFRGYYQSRINQTFGRPFRCLGAPFGPGVILTALLFGLSHVLNPFDPSAGRFELAWWWGVWTFASGLFYGLLREQTGSLLVPGIAHGLPDAVGEAFALLRS